MLDRSLMVLMLTILREQADLSCGTEENALFNDIQLRGNQPVTSGLIREHLAHASDKGWVDWRVDSVRAKRWRITGTGKSAIDDLRTGA